MTEGGQAASGVVRRLAVFAVKLGLAALLVWWLVRCGRLDTELLVSIGLGVPAIALMVAGAACVFLGQLLLAARLLLLLRRQAIHLTYARALGLTLIGSFFGAILPGLVSGDAVKTVYLFGDAAGDDARILVMHGPAGIADVARPVIARWRAHRYRRTALAAKLHPLPLCTYTSPLDTSPAAIG